MEKNSRNDKRNIPINHKMKIAFVYDRINKFGGAERVLLALHELWPEAPLYTAVYNKDKAAWADIFNIKPSYLNKVPFISAYHELFPLLTPYAFESFIFDEYDVVLSITSAEAKSIITRPQTLHICYCLTPTRYLWSGYREYLDNPGFGKLNPLVKILMQVFSPTLRRWDYISSKRADEFIAISEAVRQRIEKYYRRKAEVIYPPANIDSFHLGGVSSDAHEAGEDFFLIVSRLVPYKKIDYAIAAFNKLGGKLKIIGNGIDEQRLKKLSGRNIEFIDGNLTDTKLCWYYQSSKALIFPQTEDFGLTAVEAQACGKPVIGVGKGGLKDIIIKGITGELYENADVESLLAKLVEFDAKKFSPLACNNNAKRFSKKLFQMRMRDMIENRFNKHMEIYQTNSGSQPSFSV